MPNPSQRRWLRWGLVAAVGALSLLGVAALVVALRKPSNVSNPKVAFTSPTTTTTTAAPKRQEAVDRFVWPVYGYNEARTRVFTRGKYLEPPFRRGWRYQDGALLEFPPVILNDVMYLLDFNGWARAVSTRNGHLFWQRKVGTLSAASPAIDLRHGLVFFSLLSTTPGAHGPTNGRFVALSTKTGRIVWSRAIPSGSESSALVHGSSVFVGSQGGLVYSFRTRDGRPNWIYHASGAVKGGVAFANGKIFFGDYAGRAYAVNATTGHKVWAVSTSGADFGLGSGTFYASPAVAYGRVYIGNTDGRMYSFSERSGALAWATETGGYVYASAAVDDVPGLGPTVFAGSYSGNFYAFNARTGAIRWVHPAGGKISGPSSIVGNVVYYSDLGTHSTAGLNLRTGKRVFSFSDGAFASVIANPQSVLLVGYTSVYELLPGRTQPRRRGSAQKRSHHPAARSRGKRSREHHAAHHR
jgi:outer membrane protein assembly factor BamB